MSDYLYDFYSGGRRDPDETDCTAWVEPHKPLKSLPRMRQDKRGLRAAAVEIVSEEGRAFAMKVLENPLADRRLLQHIRSVLSRIPGDEMQ